MIQLKSFFSLNVDFYDGFRSNNSFSMFVEEDIDDVKPYEIERILNKRTVKRDRNHFVKHFVKWKNYKSEFDR